MAALVQPMAQRARDAEAAARSKGEPTVAPVLELADRALQTEERPPTLRERLEAAFAPEPEPAPDPEPVVECEPEPEPPTLRERIAAQALAVAVVEAPTAKVATPEPLAAAEELPGLEEELVEPVLVADEEKQLVRLQLVETPENVEQSDETEPPNEDREPRARPQLTLLPGGAGGEVDAPERTVEPVARGPPALVQAKLSVSSPGDALEVEADRVALQVVAGAAPLRTRKGRAAPTHAPPAPDSALPRSVTSVVTAPGGGAALDPAVRARIEPHLGYNLSAVRIRRGPDAAAAAHDLHARAFTSGSTIFLAAESSPSDLALIAHETTHVVQQQHSALARTSLLRDVSDYLPNVSVSDVIPDWILDGVRTRVRAIPGYTLLTYVTGTDPLTDTPVTVGRQELIDTLLTYGPFGPAVGPVLEAIDVLGEIFDFVSRSLAEHDLTLDRIKRDVDHAWSELSVTNGVAGNVAIVQRYVDAFLRDVRAFVVSIVDRVLEMVRAVVAEVAEPLLETPEIAPVWNLTKKVLHYDPLRGTEVNAPTAEIIADFLRLIGQEQRLAQMEERGTLQQTADWLDTQLATFAGLVTELGSLFSDAWAAIQPENLPDLMTNLESLAQRVFAFIQRVADFAATVILKILEIIKDALLGWLSENAHRVPGFHLLTVIIGENPFTGEVVPRTAENLIKGFITLMPNGEATYDQLAQAGVIGDAASRIEGEMARLGISLDMVTALFHGIWDTLSLDDLLDPIGAFERILALFGEPLSRLIEFVGVVIQVVIELVLRLMNFPSDLLASIISNALQAIEDIKRDPVQFIKNMLEAVKLGFTNFFDNILTYLVQGLGAWLFRGLGQLGITIPADLSFMSILTLVLQVLGITVEHLWQKLGEHIGPERVAMIRSAIDHLTGAWEFIKDVQEHGISAVWRFLADQLSNLWDTLLGMAKDWIMTTIIQRVTAKLLSMLDPTGIMAVVNSFIAFFNAVQSAIEYLRDILEIVNRWVTTLAAVAAGNIVPGAQMLEQGLAAAVPVAIGFLANQVGLGNVPEKIVEIIGGLRQLVDQAIDWLIDAALRLGQAALNALGLGRQADTPEDRKHAALEEVRAAMTRGIRKSALVTMLGDLKGRLQLHRAELVGEHNVVIENSPSETIEGVLSFSPEEIRGATGVAHRLPGRGGARRDVEVGQFQATGETVATIRGILEPYTADWASAGGVRVQWPTSMANLPASAFRPSRTTASLKGVLDIRVSDVPRVAGMTNVVGDLGDVEHAVRNNLGASTKTFVGGHVIAHELGGPESYENLVPMRRSLNDPVYRGVERYIVDNVRTIRPGRDPEEFPVSAELSFVIDYPGPASAPVAQLAHMVATEISPDVGTSTPGSPEHDAAIEEMEARRRAFRASIFNARGSLSIPARIPTSITLTATFTAEALSGPPPTTTTQPNVSRTLDPLIVIAAPGAPTGAAPPAAPGAAAAPPPTTGPWEHTWAFTQST